MNCIQAPNVYLVPLFFLPSLSSLIHRMRPRTRSNPEAQLQSTPIQILRTTTKEGGADQKHDRGEA
ncbi:Zinc-hook domain-containing protein [Psidium guajava]|nr:Zinc-hook domain-containing protein [Psidium guajava]